MTGTSGPTPSASYLRWEPNGSFWRTFQASLWEMEDGHHMGAPWSDSWPRSGMTRNGELFLLPMRERHINGTDGGSSPTSKWLTPTAADQRRGSKEDWRKYRDEGQTSGARLRNQVAVSEGQTLWPTPRAIYGEHPGMRDLSHLTGQAIMWPTPNASSGGTHSGISAETALSELAKGHQIGLGAAAAMWPTPTSTERSGTNPHTGKGEGLSKTARMFPTPRAGKTTDEDEESWLARHNDGKVATPPLALAARMLPTPKGTDWKGSGTSQKAIDREAEHFNLWGVVSKLNQIPTPSSGGDSGGPHGIRGVMSISPDVMPFATPSSSDSVGSHGGGQGRSLRTDTHGQGGSLSPDWVSWLMGLPVGWTSLEPLSQEDYAEWFEAQLDGTWWQEERGLPRVATGIPDRVNRLKCLGNGIVPASLSLFLRGTQ